MFEVRFSEGMDKILLLGQALKMGWIFPKFAINLLKIWKIMEKLSKNAKFAGKFSVFVRDLNWKLNNL